MADANALFEVFYLPRPMGQRFCIHHPPRARPASGAVVYVHPLAEEMNKSRRMAALQARALAAQGCAVLQIDLLGCGDSSGDLADADWDTWIDDVAAAANWLRQRHDAPLWIWGLRTGCLLAAAAAARSSVPIRLLFWQPYLNGRLALQQFLRIEFAAHLADGSGSAVLQQLRQRLASGGTVQVAGYALPAALARGLEAARLDPPPNPAAVEWFELSNRSDATIAPPAEQAQAAWRAMGWQVRSHCLSGAAFWQSTEIEEVPALIDSTTFAISRSGAKAGAAP
jgi:exosortase A-associated hydrolase 2